jgi:hypothetical protein
MSSRRRSPELPHQPFRSYRFIYSTTNRRAHIVFKRFHHLSLVSFTVAPPVAPGSPLGPRW